MSEQFLSEHKRIWEDKRVLREIYTSYYNRIMESIGEGITLEIGGGTGNLKEFCPDVVTTDIIPTPWVDLVTDAQALPFTDGAFKNIVMVDVLHHIENPSRFFIEAQRILQPGGKICMVEPAITPFSSIFYNYFHPEPVDMSADPLKVVDNDPNREPFDANQAIPTLLYGKYLNQFYNEFPQLKLELIERFDYLAYPLSGGFRKWSLIPASFANIILKLERFVPDIFSRFFAFRLFVVLRKST